ncbi:6-phosphogluconolactonase [Desulfurivibrio sp. D14AmB]|uniref:6-phosphogluconolactonase n=1 Tax=Desulfurivibrio sp. D14AmB TaxID=3374370 RepID=UPI00376EF3BB
MNIKKFPHPQAMAQAAANLIIDRARAAVTTRGFFSLVLAGGSTPLPLYELLTSPPLVREMPWAATHIFQGDERCVPPTDPASNFGRAAAVLLPPGLITPANIHRMAGELPPAVGAERYRRELAGFGHDFDLVLLGMGTDGHVASLFPGSPLLAVKDQTVAAEEQPVGSPPLPRLTLTLPAINRAATVIIMVTGGRKARIVQEIKEDPRAGAAKYPAALVRPRQELLWLVSKTDKLPTPEDEAGQLILAAGGIVEKGRGEETRIAVVYRAQYDDWSLPKGKQDPGETLADTALREVREETGLSVRFTGFAGVVHYYHGPLPKVVLYWKMAPTAEGEFMPSAEIQRLRWLTPGEALARVSYEDEKKLLRQTYQL